MIRITIDPHEFINQPVGYKENKVEFEVSPEKFIQEEIKNFSNYFLTNRIIRYCDDIDSLAEELIYHLRNHLDSIRSRENNFKLNHKAIRFQKKNYGTVNMLVDVFYLKSQHIPQNFEISVPVRFFTFQEKIEQIEYYYLNQLDKIKF